MPHAFGKVKSKLFVHHKRHQVARHICRSVGGGRYRLNYMTGARSHIRIETLDGLTLFVRVRVTHHRSKTINHFTALDYQRLHDAVKFFKRCNPDRHAWAATAYIHGNQVCTQIHSEIDGATELP